jgi:hypothetical protein
MENNKSAILKGNEQSQESIVGVNTSELLATKPNLGGRFYSDALDDSQINDIIRSVNPHLITLIGFSEFGKSTFVASMYHRAMTQGKIDGYDFFDSDTFSGFERRAYIRDVGLKPNKRFNRTTNNEGYFLTMYFKKDNERLLLVISDRSGETYRNEYTSNAEAVKADKSLIYSNHIVFFIDVSVLMTIKNYLRFKSKFTTLISRLYSAGVFNNEKVIDVIFNKIDLLEEGDENVRLLFESNAKEVIQIIEDTSPTKIKRQFKICSNNMEDNHDLYEVFDYFVESCKLVNIPTAAEIDWINTKVKEL